MHYKYQRVKNKNTHVYSTQNSACSWTVLTIGKIFWKRVFATELKFIGGLKKLLPTPVKMTKCRALFVA